MGKAIKARILILVVAGSLYGCSQNSKFESSVWKSKPTDHYALDYREKMVGNLLNSGILNNKTKEDVVKLLGDNEWGSKTLDTFTYLVREKYSFDIDPDYIKTLHIIFENDVVKKYKLQGG